MCRRGSPRASPAAARRRRAAARSSESARGDRVGWPPSASRMPSSGVRWATSYASRPNTPIIASVSATAAKADEERRVRARLSDRRGRAGPRRSRCGQPAGSDRSTGSSSRTGAASASGSPSVLATSVMSVTDRCSVRHVHFRHRLRLQRARPDVLDDADDLPHAAGNVAFGGPIAGRSAASRSRARAGCRSGSRPASSMRAIVSLMTATLRPSARSSVGERPSGRERYAHDREVVGADAAIVHLLLVAALGRGPALDVEAGARIGAGERHDSRTRRRRSRPAARASASSASS